MSLILCGVFIGCAVPVPPTGGPPDQDPPTLTSSVPGDGAVNQNVDGIRLVFDEALDVRSAAQAISLIPEFSAPLDVRVRGNRIEIKFPESLRPNTTYILTVDSALRDAHNVSLTQPITVAFGTGPVLNRGRLNGTVLRYRDGMPAGSVDVYAYESDSTDVHVGDRLPDYRTQTDAQGHFSLAYMREGPYMVVGLQDRNRNRRIDSGEPTAIPPVVALNADSVGQSVNRPWVLATIDTENPRIENVQARSARELEVRFSEPIILENTSVNDWQLLDSTSAEIRSVRDMYALPGGRAILLRHEVLPPSTHILKGYGAVSDSSGNRMTIGSFTFIPSSIPVDSTVSFMGFLPDSLTAGIDAIFPLWPGIRPVLTFSAPPGSAWRITVRDTSQVAVDHIMASDDGIHWVVGQPLFRRPLEISVNGPDTTYSRIFEQVRSNRLGELSGVVAAHNGAVAAIVELIRDDSGRFVYTTGSDAAGQFRFSGLPGGTRYLVRAFLDLNGDRKWNPGQLNPFRPAEPIGWETVEEMVRARWETVIPDTVKVVDN